MKKDFACLTILLDSSGSMGSIKNDVIGGFNNLIDEQKKLPGQCVVTLVSFDYGPFRNEESGYKVIYDMVDINHVKPLDAKTYTPRGSTALLDSFANLIDRLGGKLANLSESERPERNIFCVISDGEENSSIKFNHTDVKNRVEHQKDKYNWVFTYIGSNQNSILESAKLGINAAHTINFASNHIGTSNVYARTSNLVGSLRSCAVDKMEKQGYSEDDRKAAMASQ